MLNFCQQNGEIAANLNAALEESLVGPALIRASHPGHSESACVAGEPGLEAEASGISRTQGPDRKQRPIRRLRSTDSRSLGGHRGLPPHRGNHDWSRPEGSGRIWVLDRL